MSDGTVSALWVAPYEATLEDGTHLVPGETVAQIGSDEARDSDNWRPQVSAPAPTATVVQPPAPAPILGSTPQPGSDA